MSTELELSQKSLSEAAEVDKKVSDLLMSKSTGFEYSLQKATVVQAIQDMLTTEVMKPIMAMCGKPYGFRTDKDAKGEKYKEEIVRDCLIQATLLGVEPTGNQFNIIGGNCYITKDGLANKLKKLGIYTKLTASVSRKIEVDGRAVWVKPIIMEYEKDGKIIKETKDFIYAKYDSTSEAAAEGMAKRDAYDYILGEVTGIKCPVGDVEDKPIDITSKVMKEDPKQDDVKVEKNENIENAEIVEEEIKPTQKEIGAMNHLKNAKDLDMLEKRFSEVKAAGHSQSKFVNDKYKEVKESLTAK